MKTSYIYDITMPYYEVLTEKTNGVITAYDYGIERISAITSDFWHNIKTAYVYDGRGSVTQEVSYDISWYTINTPFAPSYISSKSYTPFGEQIDDKVSGYGYNGEYYDAAMGMVNLRARQYEPAMMRFVQKDTVKGNIEEPWTQNLYAYCANDPVNYVDPSGHFGVFDKFTKAVDKINKEKKNEEKKKASGIYKQQPSKKKYSIQSMYAMTAYEYTVKNIVKQSKKTVWDYVGAVYKEEARQLKIRSDKVWHPSADDIWSDTIYNWANYISIGGYGNLVDSSKGMLSPKHSLNDYLSIQNITDTLNVVLSLTAAASAGKALGEKLYGTANIILNGGGASTSPSKVNFMLDENGNFSCSADDVAENASKTISMTDYNKIMDRATHNGDSDEVMLGKYDDGSPTNYINKAEGRSYFGSAE